MKRRISKNDFDANLKIGSKKFWEKTSRQLHLGITAEMQYFSKIGPEGMLKRRDECFEIQSSCPLCSSNRIRHLIDRMAISVWRCKECGFGFQNPRLKEIVAAKIYENEKTSPETFDNKSQVKIDRAKYRYGYNQILKGFGKQLHTILDIGCGNGLSLDTALDEGWTKAIGIEPNRNYSYSKRSGKVLYHADISALNIPEQTINAITAWDVMEHIYNLKTFVGTVRKSLTAGGAFLSMVPNLDSLASRLFREKSSTFYWGHVNYFTKDTLEGLLTENGFEIVNSETVISEIGNINNYLCFEDPYTGESENIPLFDFLTTELIHEKFLGSRLLVIAKKS